MRTMKGIIAPATTAFDRNGNLDLDAAKQQFQWLADCGCHGIAVGGDVEHGQRVGRHLRPQQRALIVDVGGDEGAQVPVRRRGGVVEALGHFGAGRTV